MRIPSFLLTDEATREARSGSSAYGNVLTAAETIRCAFQLGYRRALNARGEEVVASALLFANPTQALAVGDKITYGGVAYTIIDVQPNASHKEAMLQSVGVAA